MAKGFEGCDNCWGTGFHRGYGAPCTKGAPEPEVQLLEVPEQKFKIGNFVATPTGWKNIDDAAAKTWAYDGTDGDRCGAVVLPPRMSAHTTVAHPVHGLYDIEDGCVNFVPPPKFGVGDVVAVANNGWKCKIVNITYNDSNPHEGWWYGLMDSINNVWWNPERVVYKW